MKTPIVKFPFAAVAAAVLAATLPLTSLAAELSFPVTKLVGVAAAQDAKLAIVDATCNASGACTEIELATGAGLDAGAELWVGWGETDGDGDLDAFDGKRMLASVSERSRYAVGIPAGPGYVQFFLIERLSFRSDGTATIETPVFLDKNAKMTVVFRATDFVTGQGVAGSRGGARDRNFALSVGNGSICLDYNDQGGSSGTIVGRLSVTDGLDASHWYQAEISAGQRKVTDLTTGRTWTNGDSATPPYDFTTPTKCVLFAASGYNGNFTGDVKSFVLETNGVKAVHYKGVFVGGEPVFMDLVSGAAPEVRGGTIAPAVETTATESRCVAPSLPAPFVVTELDGKVPTPADAFAIVGSRCDRSGACTEVELITGVLTIEDAELWVAWGETDANDVGAFDFKAKLTAVSEGARYKVVIPKGPKYLRFFLDGRSVPCKGDGKAWIETPVYLDKNAKMTVVFRATDFVTGQGVAGSRGGARDRNFTLSVGNGSICLDYNDCGSGDIVGRLSIDEGLDASHWYQAEISASQRKVTDLTTGQIWTNDDPLTASYDFTTPTTCRLFGVGNGSWASNFKGDIRRFVLETNGVKAVHYEGFAVGGVSNLVELVGGAAVQVQGGVVTLQGTYLTETCSVGADAFGSGRPVVSVEPVGARSNPTAHRLVFGPSDGQDYLLVQCRGLSPQGSAYQSWGNYRMVDLIPATSNEFVCAIPSGWGRDYTLMRYFLIKPAAKANGGTVDTGVFLQSGDTMAVEFNIGSGGVSAGVAGYRAGTAVTNISVSYTASTAVNQSVISGGYNNGTSDCNLSVERGNEYWYRMEVSPERRILTKLDTGTAWTNDVPYADEPFVTTETCLLYFCRGMSEFWTKFSGSISRFSVTRENKKIIDLFPLSDGGKTYFRDLVTGGRFYGQGAELTFEHRDEALSASRTINARRSAGLVLMLK